MRGRERRPLRAEIVGREGGRWGEVEGEVDEWACW